MRDMERHDVTFSISVKMDSGKFDAMFNGIVKAFAEAAKQSHQPQRAASVTDLDDDPSFARFCHVLGRE